MKRRAAIGSLVGVLLVTARARAIDPFEIQVYDGTSNAPGAPGLELHVNRVMTGLSTANGTELAPNHQTHFTLEPSLGITDWWELGGYFQTALRGDGTFDYAGVKLRSKFVTPPKWQPHLRLGLNLELSVLPSTYDGGQLGGEMRPIVAWENERWLFVVNPILDLSFTRPESGAEVTFEPAAMAKIKLSDTVALGLEYYTDLGPLTDWLPAREQVHYLYEAADLLSVRHFELNVGVGEGLTPASNAFVAKMIVGYVWESEAPRPPPDPHDGPRVVSTR